MAGPQSARAQLWLLALATAAIALGQGLRVIADADLWWHVRTGELILEQRAIPQRDVFSFTAAGAPWQNHEWLTEAILAGLFRAGGGAGLTLFRLTCVGAASALLAWLLLRRARLPILAAGILAVLFPALTWLLNVRAHSFTYVLTLVVMALFELAGERPRVLFFLPPLLALWANLHGGFLFGFLVVGMGLAAHFTGLEHPPRQRPSSPPRRFWLLLALSAVAALATPSGIHIVVFVLRVMGADNRAVSEWRSVSDLPALWPLFLGLVLPPFVALLRAPARARLTETTLFLGCVVLGFRHARFLALVAIFASLVLASALGAWWEGRRTRSSRAPWLASTPALAVLAAALTLWALPRVLADWSRKGLELEIDHRLVPVLATRFLADHDLGPHLMTRLDWGGYAIYHLWPRYRVSIDGRNVTVYPARFVTDQIAAYDRGEPLAGLRGARVDVALVESAGPGFEGMRREPGWVMVFRDPLSAVFVPRQRAERLARSHPRGGSYEFTERLPTFP